MNPLQGMLEGIRTFHKIGKERVKRLDGRDAAGQAKFVEGLFEVAV